MSGYREVANGLRIAINQGEYKPGTTLPKQEELAERYGVNIKTVRQAVGLLEAEDLSQPSGGAGRWSASGRHFAGSV